MPTAVGVFFHDRGQDIFTAVSVFYVRSCAKLFTVVSKAYLRSWKKIFTVVGIPKKTKLVYSYKPMNMEAFVLGCGGMMPLPYRHLTSVLLRRDGDLFLFDGGEGTQVSLRRLNLKWK